MDSLVSYTIYTDTLFQDRILATCDANNLEYVTDSTDLHPDVPLRDHVRLILDNPTSEVSDTPVSSSWEFSSIKPGVDLAKNS